MNEVIKSLLTNVLLFAITTDNDENSLKQIK